MFALILKDLTAAPTRALLTGLTTLVGLLALIASVLVGTIGTEYLEGTNAQLTGESPSYSAAISTQLDTVPLEQLEELTSTLQQHPGASSALQYSLDQPIEVRMDSALGSPSLPATTDVRAVTSGYASIYRLPLVSGQWLPPESKPRTLTVVVNQAAATELAGASTVFLASPTSVTASPAAVIGVVADGSKDPVIYLDAHSAALFAPQLWTPTDASILWHDTTGRTEDSLRPLLNDALAETTGGTVDSIERIDNADQYQSVISALQTGFLVAAIALLFVAAIALMNIEIAALHQRTRELLIFRALGATRFHLASLVLGGAVTLSLLVSAIALALAFVGVWIIGQQLPADSPVSAPAFPVSAALIAVAAAVLTAVIGSIVPAIRASRLEPALALR